jgi:hypothetical protein
MRFCAAGVDELDVGGGRVVHMMSLQQQNVSTGRMRTVRVQAAHTDMPLKSGGDCSDSGGGGKAGGEVDEWAWELYADQGWVQLDSHAVGTLTAAYKAGKESATYIGRHCPAPACTHMCPIVTNAPLRFFPHTRRRTRLACKQKRFPSLHWRFCSHACRYDIGGDGWQFMWCGHHRVKAFFVVTG